MGKGATDDSRNLFGTWEGVWRVPFHGVAFLEGHEVGGCMFEWLE